MRPLRPIYLVRGAQSDFLGRGHPGWHDRRAQAEGATNPGLRDHLREAVRGVLQGLDARAVDRAYVGNFLGELFCRQGHLGTALADVEPALDGVPAARIEAACASGGSAVVAAVEALQAGHHVALVAGVEIETNARGRDGVDYLARADDAAAAAAIEPNTFPYRFAMRAKASCETFGWDRAVLAEVAAKAYAAAARNPWAQMRQAPWTTSDLAGPGPANPEFLEDPSLAPFMRLLESTTFTDGAAAVLLATDEGLRRLDIDPSDAVRLEGYGVSTAPLATPADPLRMSNVARAAARAYAAAQLQPSDIDVAELHDCFAITELQLTEALGFVGEGQAAAAFRAGHTAHDGATPVNPGGGLLGTGHPVGATGVRQVADLWRHLTGTSATPVHSPPSVGLAANLGGDDRTGVVTVWRRPS